MELGSGSEGYVSSSFSESGAYEGGAHLPPPPTSALGVRQSRTRGPPSAGFGGMLLARSAGAILAMRSTEFEALRDANGARPRASSATDCTRRSGSFSRQRMTSASSAAGVPFRRTPTGSGVSAAMLALSAVRLLPPKGRWPLSIS